MNNTKRNCNRYSATEWSLQSILQSIYFSKKFILFIEKKGKRKVQRVPQSQTAALPRPQEEEKTDKSKQAQIEQTYEKH